MPVDTTHKEYNAMMPKWQLVRAIIDNNASKYIREIDKNDPKRTKQYREDAILTNFTRLTQDGLIGLVYRKPAKIEVPAELEYLVDDATGTGFGLEQASQAHMLELFKTGRIGLLADMCLDAGSDGLARIKSYAAENIRMWKTRTVGSKTLPWLITLSETTEKVDPDDVFSCDEVVQYRVLFLNSNNEYEQHIYDEDQNLVSAIMPLDYNGKPFNEIPFMFVGSENNDPKCDPIPLFDLAMLNLGHYKNSADYEESIFITGQPTLFVSMEMSEEEFKLMNPNGMKIGARGGHNLGPNGKAELVQANPNQLVAQAMKEKIEQAAYIGARLIAQAGGRETAEAARIRYGAQNSALYNMTHNESRAIEQMLWWLSVFMMETPAESEFELNDQYYEDSADPLLIAQEIMLMQNGVISKDDIRNNLRGVGVIPMDRSNEDIEKEIDLVDPMIGAPIVPTRRTNAPSSAVNATGTDTGGSD